MRLELRRDGDAWRVSDDIGFATESAENLGDALAKWHAAFQAMHLALGDQRVRDAGPEGLRRWAKLLGDTA